MTRHVFVGNISPETTAATIRETFEREGRTVKTVSLVSNSKGKPRGFGFVEMGSEEEAQAVIASLDGTEVDGKPLRVKEGQPRPEPRIAEAPTTRGRGGKKGRR